LTRLKRAHFTFIHLAVIAVCFALALSPARDVFGTYFDPRGEHLRFYSRGSLRSLLSEFGFHDVRVHARGRVLGVGRRVLFASARRSRF